MHRGRGENRSACNDRGARASMRPFSARQESRDHGRGKRENLNWNLSRSESKNLPGFSNLAAREHNRILIIRRHIVDAVSQEEARLDPGVADSVIDFLSTSQEIPRDFGSLGIQHILTKPDVQGRARAVLSSLHEECKTKLHRNDSAEGNTKGDSGSSFSCRISRGPALSHSLEWTGRQKQSQNQAFAGVPSHNPHLAASCMNGSYFPLQEAGMFGKRRLWDSRTDMQQRRPNTGWWRRILFGALAGAAGIRLMSLKYPWLLLSELFSLPYFRRNAHQKTMEVVERRSLWRIPVKVATAISSRFCGSLSNSVVAAHFLLLIFELRNVIDSERLSDLAPKNRTEVGLRCCSCLASCSQGRTCSEPSKLISRPAETCHVKSSGELDQVLVNDKLLLDRREDIAHMLVGLARKGREVKGNSTSEEDIVHLAELIHAALSMPKRSLDKLLHSEPLALPPAFEERNSRGQADSHIYISFVSKGFTEGIELVFPQNTPMNEDRMCIAATATDPDFQSAQRASAHFVEGDPRASQNSALLKSILLEKCKSGSIHSSKSSVYASDVESEYFFEACSMSLPDLEHSEYQEPQMGPSSDNLEGWRSTSSDVLSILGDDHTLTEETRACHDSQNSSDLDALLDQLAEIQSAEAPQTLHGAHTGLNVTTTKCNNEMTPTVATCAPHHFADHPTCISLRERRHDYGDQNYLTPDKLKTSRWRKLVFWHGHCREGNPSLYILLGKAVQQLPVAELQIISSVIISQMEYAELNFFRKSAKQMNIIMDLWGIGLMRMPPLEILSRVGMIMNRDYAGRGGSILLINAPVMLSLVIGAIKRVILRPGYNKGALIEKGFLEKKDQILFFNRNYKHALEKHFDLTLLPSMFGGKCNSKFCPEDCNHGVQFLERL